MIYTVTFNPSVDCILHIGDVKFGGLNRASKEEFFFSGKGINVSIVLKNLGLDSTAFGYVAGFTGDELIRRLNEFGVDSDFIKIGHGMTRINLKLKSIDGTEINGSGPVISPEDVEKLMEKLDKLGEGDVLFLAGSIPTVLPPTIYRDIMKRLQKREVMIVVDATKDLLVNVLEYHPFLIKPNNYELGEIFGVTLSTKEDVILYAKKLQEMGAANVLVSMAGDGAVLVAEDGSTYKSEAPEGKVKNSVGAGDSMVAGFLYGYLKSGIYEDAFYYGVCTGSASAFSENLATREEVDTLLRNIKNRA